jgi:hypothetical protein
VPSYARRLLRPSERPAPPVQHASVISGNFPVSSPRKRFGALALLGVFAALQGGAPSAPLDVPDGFAACVYARDIAGARGLHVDADGTLTVHGRERSEAFEITPATEGHPVTVMRVAPELEAADAAAQATALSDSPAPDAPRTDIPVAAETLALARALERRALAVELSPDGILYVADPHAGVIFRVRRL